MRLRSRISKDPRPGLRALTSALVASAVLLLPRLSEACAVCTSGNEDENRLAFILTTAFLTVLPLGMVGGLVYWLRRRVMALEASHDEARAVGSVSG